MKTYARAIHTRKVEPGTNLVELAEWDAARLRQRTDHRRKPTERSAPDLLDFDFVAFHRCLRQYMMDEYGLLGDSEAFDLHAAIAPCIVFLSDESDDTQAANTDGIAA